MRKLIAVVLALAALSAYAYECTTNTVFLPDGKMMSCTTCCSNGYCTTTCL